MTKKELKQLAKEFGVIVYSVKQVNEGYKIKYAVVLRADTVSAQAERELEASNYYELLDAIERM